MFLTQTRSTAQTFGISNMTLPLEYEPKAVDLQPQTVDVLSAESDRPGLRLWAVLDACDEPGVPLKLNELGRQRAVSLYRGWAEQDYRSIAPCLFAADSALIDWIFENLTGTPWGFLCVAPESLQIEDVRRHFRRFLQLKGPEKNLLFRFYDPRVLKAFLVSGSSQMVAEFFGQLHTILIPDSAAELLEIRQSEHSIPGPGLFPVAGRPGRITQAQVQAVADHQALDFQRRLHEHLTAALDRKAPLSPDGLWREIESGISSARAHELERESDIARFVEGILSRFDSVPERLPAPILSILYDRRRPIPERLDTLEQLLEQSPAV